MISAHEHGWNAARRGKHIQACPFDAGTAEWQAWRDGFLLSTGQCTQEASAVATAHGGVWTPVQVTAVLRRLLRVSTQGCVKARTLATSGRDSEPSKRTGQPH
jgi:hypothetical protein